MEENVEMDAPTTILTDEFGRTLTCYVEKTIELDGEEYVLLMPVDSPVEIFAWQQDDESEEEPLLVEDDAEIDRLFPLAKAVLEEQNLTLKRTAVALTVEGDLPEIEDEFEEDEDSALDEEELQLLASFYYEEQEYGIYTPLDPFFILARLDEQGNPLLLSPDEMERLEPMLPMLEDQLFDEME